ncbi:nucleotidyltransferase family protein [Dyadobacter sediminis]|nr:nucleotidyltransferase family protein [Dyadobacter sediminis]
MDIESIDWIKLQKMAGYHSIRPTVYHVLKGQTIQYTAGAPDAFVKELHRIAVSKTLLQQQMALETERLLILLEQQSIAVFPYKGAILSKILYASSNLREWSDLDLFVPRKFAKAALKTLLDDGYQFAQEETNHAYNSDTNFLDKLLFENGWHEIGLSKSQENSLPFQLDFHWQLCEDFYPYTINENDIITGAQKFKLVDSEVIVPSIEHIFLMTLLHHGGRESWMRLKYICDLSLFIKLFPDNLFWERILSLCDTAKLKRSLLLGCFCVQKYLNVALPAILESKVKSYGERNTRNILKSWENSVSFWESMSAQLIHKRILLSHQDEKFSPFNYWIKYMEFYSTPNPMEQPRLRTFNKKYKIANFFSKVVTYVWLKGFR